MKKIYENIDKHNYENYFDERGIKDWGDQVDIFLGAVEQKDLEDNITYDVTFIRCTKDEFLSHDIATIKNLCETQDYTRAEILKNKIENQAKAIDLMLELI